MKNLATPLGEYLSEDRYPNSQVTPSDFSMKVLEHNLGSTVYLGDLELYFERSWIYHNKIEDERTKGYKYYFSSYFSISDYAILYEYKDYNSPYYFSVYSNPPIVFKENSSTLISRNLHNVDFSNEVGHHILINKSFSEQINVVLSSAFSFNPIRDDSKRFGFGRIFKEMFNLHLLGKLTDAGFLEEKASAVFGSERVFSRVIPKSDGKIKMFITKRDLTPEEKVDFGFGGEAIGFFKLSAEDCKKFIAHYEKFESEYVELLWEIPFSDFAKSVDLDVWLITQGPDCFEIDTQVDYEQALSCFQKYRKNY